jgi:hypothetical protein
MSMLALIAVLEAAVATGLGIGLVPAVHAGALDGFAAGMLLSGTVFLGVLAPGQVMRRVGPVASAARRMAAPRLPGRVLGEYPWLGRQVKAADPRGGDAGDPLPSGGRQDKTTAGSPGPSRRPGGYRSKHRVSGPDDSRSRPENRRRPPRHAAPSSVLVDRLGGFMQVRELAVAD